MARKTGIEWTDTTWNPIRGCSRVSDGCRHCYAESVAARFSGPGLPYEGLARRVSLPSGGSEARWTNEVAFAGDKTLQAPLRWRAPRRIFVNSMSDLFHENVPDEIIDRVFAVMALCPQHTFQILTKRPERMRTYAGNRETAVRVYDLVCDMAIDLTLPVMLVAPGIDPTLAPPGQRVYLAQWPLPNVWLGVSVEDQVTAETRIPYLLQTPAAMRFISAEPLLGPINLAELQVAPEARLFGFPILDATLGTHRAYDPPFGPPTKEPGRCRIDWVIVGGESGRGARPMHPDWARSLRDQCATANVPFFFKQWGEWAPGTHVVRTTGYMDTADWFDGKWSFGRTNLAITDGHIDDEPDLYRVGKRGKPRKLDGQDHNGVPT